METSLKSDGYSRLKLNGRLGGSNEYVKNLSERAAPLLIMGADVAHAGPGSSLKSVASYVSMIDAECTRPFTSLREHATLREEKLVDLEQVMRQHLIAFYEHRKAMPQTIVVYRDGIAHSGFGAMGEAEIGAIKRACDGFQEQYCPHVLFIVVQKRNLTRLFRRSQVGDAIERRDLTGTQPDAPHPLYNNQGEIVGWANVPSGTVVDEEVTMDLRADVSGGSSEYAEQYANFWLVPHLALQGTTSVPNYHVLANTGGLSIDEIQRLTYDLCHLHYKCPRSVSVPAPVYSADLAAGRGQGILKELQRLRPGPAPESSPLLLDLDDEQSQMLFF